VFWGFDPKAYSVSANFEDGDFNVVGNNDFLVFLTTDNKQSNPPFSEVLSTL
jgi:hypothetical protein